MPDGSIAIVQESIEVDLCRQHSGHLSDDQFGGDSSSDDSDSDGDSEGDS